MNREVASAGFKQLDAHANAAEASSYNRDGYIVDILRMLRHEDDAVFHDAAQQQMVLVERPNA